MDAALAYVRINLFRVFVVLGAGKSQGISVSAYLSGKNVSFSGEKQIL